MAVLVAYDGSEPAQTAVEHAFTMYSDHEIVLLRVIEAADGAPGASVKIAQDMIRDRKEEISEEFPEEIRDIVSDPDLEFRTELVAGNPAREIVSYATNHDIDHIIVGSHGRSGLSRVLLGSVAETVVRRSPVPVTVMR